jgi:hypothetical protein
VSAFRSHFDYVAFARFVIGFRYPYESLTHDGGSQFGMISQHSQTASLLTSSRTFRLRWSQISKASCPERNRRTSRDCFPSVPQIDQAFFGPRTAMNRVSCEFSFSGIASSFFLLDIKLGRRASSRWGSVGNPSSCSWTRSFGWG